MGIAITDQKKIIKCNSSQKKSDLFVFCASDSGFHASDSGFHAADSGLRASDSGLHAVDSGLHAVDSGFHAVDSGLQVLDFKDISKWFPDLYFKWDSACQELDSGHGKLTVH